MHTSTMIGNITKKYFNKKITWSKIIPAILLIYLFEK